MRIDRSDPITQFPLMPTACGQFVRPARALGLVAGLAATGALVLAAISPAAAQLRGDIGSRTFSVGPRMSSPGSFGARLDPTFRTTPGGSGDPATTDAGGDGGSPKTLKLNTNKTNANNNSGSPQTNRRARSGVPPANERRYVPDEVVIESRRHLERAAGSGAGQPLPPDPDRVAAQQPDQQHLLPLAHCGRTFGAGRHPHGGRRRVRPDRAAELSLCDRPGAVAAGRRPGPVRARQAQAGRGARRRHRRQGAGGGDRFRHRRRPSRTGRRRSPGHTTRSSRRRDRIRTAPALPASSPRMGG